MMLVMLGDFGHFRAAAKILAPPPAPEETDKHVRLCEKLGMGDLDLEPSTDLVAKGEARIKHSC